MCGRFVLQADYSGLQLAFPGFVFPDEIPDRFNIAPTQNVLAIKNDSSRSVDFLRWGLVPSWSKDIKLGSRLINARSETVAEKPSFRSAFKRRRCLIPVSGYYEWVKVKGEKKKQPIYISMSSSLPFALAGIWEIWHSPEGDEVHTCSILTTDANPFLNDFHHRMPVIVGCSDMDDWLDDREKTYDELAKIMIPYPEEGLVSHYVSSLVNSPSNNKSECIQPIEV